MQSSSGAVIGKFCSKLAG